MCMHRRQCRSPMVTLSHFILPRACARRVGGVIGCVWRVCAGPRRVRRSSPRAGVYGGGDVAVFDTDADAHACAGSARAHGTCEAPPATRCCSTYAPQCACATSGGPVPRLPSPVAHHRALSHTPVRRQHLPLLHQHFQALVHFEPRGLCCFAPHLLPRAGPTGHQQS